MQVCARFDVNDQPVAPGAHVLGSHDVGGQYHQVRLERQRRVLARRGDHIGAKRQVGHELPVHHIPLDAVDAGSLQRGHFFAEFGEVGGQHAGGDLDRAGHSVEASRSGP